MIPTIVFREKEPHWLEEKRLLAGKAYAAEAPERFYKYGLNIITPLESLRPPADSAQGGSVTVSSPEFVAAEPPRHLFAALPAGRFANLHAARAAPLCLRIPDRTILERPLVVRKVQKGAGFFEHLLIDVGKDCSLTILDSLEGGGNYHSGGLEIHVGEGSSLLFGSTQHLSAGTSNIALKAAVVARDARLDWVHIDTGSRLTISRIAGQMNAPGGSLFTKLLTYGTGSQHFDLAAASTHAAPDTQSDILQKAVLDGRARLVLNGLVKICQNAARSNGYQKEDTLLLSPEAEAAPVPSLEIDNNDVRCSHGTTVGQVDKELLFYAMARGIDEETAIRMAVQGFVEPLIAALPLPSLQEQIRMIISRRLEERGAR